MNDQDRDAILEAYLHSTKTPLQIVEEYMTKKNTKQLDNDLITAKALAKVAFAVFFVLLAAAAILLIASV